MPDTSRGNANAAVLLGLLAGIVLLTTGGKVYLVRAAAGVIVIVMGASLLFRKRGVLLRHMAIIDPTLAARDPQGQSGQWTALGVVCLVSGLFLISSYWM